MIPALALLLIDLTSAAYKDDAPAVRAEIARGASVNAPNRYGMTPLAVACANGNSAIVELLLKAGADVDTPVPGGETPLMSAARSGNADVVRMLLKAGANVNAAESKRGQTALMWAAAEGHADVVQTLIDAGADVRARLASGFNAMLFAVREGHAPVVRVLLKAGIDINEPLPAVKRPRGGPLPGTTALHIAVASAHYELASELLDRGADPNAAGPGWTVLHTVTWVRKPGGGDNDPAPRGSGNMDSLEFVRRVAAKGADLNARMARKVGVGLTSLNTAGATPFLLAARTGDAELMRLLASLGADPKIPNNDGATPLIIAAGLGTRSPGEDAGTEAEVVEAVRAALDLGNDINAVDKNGETAMHGAAYKNLPAVVELLAERGADMKVWNRPNKQGWSPLTIAEGHRFGNYKPSAVTVAAFHRVFKSAGVPIPPPFKAVPTANSDYATTSPLKGELDKLARSIDGRLGACVQYRGGAPTCVNGEPRFSLQSVMKLVVGMAVLDKGISREEPVVVRKKDLSLYVQPLAKLLNEHGYPTTVGDLIRRAVVDSDSAATDILIAKLGGPKAVQEFLKRKGIGGMRIDRDERHLQTEIAGIEWRDEFVEPALLEKAMAAVPRDARAAAYRRYQTDERDTSTPAAMTALLHELAAGKLLDAAGTRFLLDVMEATVTFPDRLKAGVSGAWKLGHKTGTSGSWDGVTAATNDVGILTGPNGQFAAVTVFIGDSRASSEDKAAVMARVAAAAIRHAPAR